MHFYYVLAKCFKVSLAQLQVFFLHTFSAFVTVNSVYYLSICTETHLPDSQENAVARRDFVFNWNCAWATVRLTIQLSIMHSGFPFQKLSIFC